MMTIAFRSKTLLGLKVRVFISVPWEFVTEHGPGPFIARILHVDNELKSALIQFEPAIISHNTVHEYFIIKVRQKSESLKGLKANQRIACYLTKLRRDQLSLDNPFELHWSSGDLVLIGTLLSK